MTVHWGSLLAVFLVSLGSAVAAAYLTAAALVVLFGFWVIIMR
jgi:hypothetical protein